MGVFLILFSISYISLTFYQRQLASNTSFASITPLARQIMVVDMNQQGIFTTDMVNSGQLPILAISPSHDLTDQSKIELNFLDHIGRLVVFDTDNNNRVDTMDPIFSRLELVYIKQKQIIQTIPIIDVGIRAIYLDRGNLTPIELFPNGPKGYWNVTNLALLADGTKRVIRVIPINATDLPNLNA